MFAGLFGFEGDASAFDDFYAVLVGSKPDAEVFQVVGHPIEYPVGGREGGWGVDVGGEVGDLRVEVSAVEGGGDFWDEMGTDHGGVGFVEPGTWFGG